MDTTLKMFAIYEYMIPLKASAVGYHDASGEGFGGVWFPSDKIAFLQGYSNAPVVWRVRWPSEIQALLFTDENPTGSITIADLELAGGLLHLEALCQTHDIRERTVCSKTDNMAAMFWQRKGGTSTNQAPAHLLRLFEIYQRYHR